MFTILTSSSLIHSSPSLILLWVPSHVSFISHVLFTTDFLFLRSSRCLLNISCIFSICASIRFICASTVFLRFWTIFILIILNCFSGILPIFSSFVWSYEFLSCSFICCILLCFVILFNLLCLGSPFCRQESALSRLDWPSTFCREGKGKTEKTATDEGTR